MRVVGAGLVVGLMALMAGLVAPAHADAATVILPPVNPVRVDLNGHPANSGFLAFVKGDVTLNADESERTIAVGGTLSFGTTYNVVAGAPPVDSTFTAPGDSGPTYLYVGGGIDWGPSGSDILRVENDGFTKVADQATYTAHNTDQNGQSAPYRINKPGEAYEANPHIEGRTAAQTPESIAKPVPKSLIDVGGAFSLYRQLTTQMAACPANAVLTNPDTGIALPEPIPAGARGRLPLIQGRTNLLNLPASDLAHLAEISFPDPPNAATPLIVNVTGASFSGNMPNLPGGGGSAPYIIWNFPTAAAIDVLGGDSIEGTIYAPNAALNWEPTPRTSRATSSPSPSFTASC